MGAFAIHIHRVAIHRRLIGNAIQQFQFRWLQTLRRNMASRRQAQCDAATAGASLRYHLVQLASEIDVPSLVTRCVCVGDVGSQNFLPLGVQVQRLLTKTQTRVQFVEHVLSARLEFRADSINAPIASLSSE
ncbi:hypothetical protein D3C73_1381160 [compost metagenome]